MRVIDNASKWLEEDLQEHLTGETRQNMNLLRQRIGRMERLLDDLLEYSRIGRSSNERYDEIITGDALMGNVLAMLSPPAGFTVNVSPGFADINVRSMPLQQIMMNLIGNAIKHHDKTTGCIDARVEDVGTQYAFAVKDDGPGIPAQFHDQVFKMFQTLKPRDQVEGSGMGLAIVRKNIESLRRNAQSRILRRQRKHIPLHVAETAENAWQARRNVSPALDAGTLNILLVEDDDGDAKAVLRAFRKSTLVNSIMRAVDGIEALDILRGSNGKAKLLPPYLLLVDMNMPRMNGIQLVKALREDDALRHAVVFVLSTSKREEDKMAAYDLNVAGYIFKGTAGRDFLNLVNLIECYKRIVELP